MRATSSSIAGRFTDWVARRYLRKPDQAGLLRVKFPTWDAIGHAALNEAAYLAGLERSGRLTTLNVEITNRCNLRCEYCPVNRDLARAKLDMPFDAFCELIVRTPTLTTLLPFQWGEPLLHPRVFDMIAFAARRGIRTFVTTNGTRLDADTRQALLRSGLTRLTISVDGDDATHLRMRGQELAPVRERVLALRRERDAAGVALAIDVSMVLDATTAPAHDEYVRAWTGVADRVQTIPRMIDAPRTTACREPWRGLLVVLADGTTTACCADREGELALGNAFTTDPARIFDGPAMRELRRRHAQRTFTGPCARCSEFDHPAISRRFG
ncbi:MAG: radical SAM protein [Planctomycetes bacterium]|nr:radical SAM protein [Planctomycetota bacterium]